MMQHKNYVVLLSLLQLHIKSCTAIFVYGHIKSLNTLMKKVVTEPMTKHVSIIFVAKIKECVKKIWVLHVAPVKKEIAWSYLVNNTAVYACCALVALVILQPTYFLRYRGKKLC